MDMNNIFGQIEMVKKRLRQLQQELHEMDVEGEDSNQVITAVVSGSGQVRDFHFNPNMMGAINQEQLITALVESVNLGLKKAKELEAEKKQEIVQELNIPNIPGLFDM